MIEAEFLRSVVGALTNLFVKKGGKIGEDRIKTWIESAKKTYDSPYPQDKELESIISEITKHPPKLGAEITNSMLARWFEISPEEFKFVSAEELDPQVFFRHLYLETAFEKWLMEWGYKVELGEELEGLEGLEYVADVSAELKTLHGTFQIIINFICDEPPSVYRGLAILEMLEAYAPKGCSSFGTNDVFIIATPFKFGKKITNSIRIQNKQEDYIVVKLEGDDLWDLFHAKDTLDRMGELKERIEHAKKID